MTVSHYVNNKQLTTELSPWAETQRERLKRGDRKEIVPDYIARCILAICTNIVKKPNFANYTFREEMVGDAIENCIKYIHNFDGEKSRNAFSYITQIAFSAIVRKIKKEKLVSTKHLRFIKGLVDVNQLSNVVSSASAQEHDHYNGYLNNLKTLIDDLGTIEEVTKIPPVQSKRKTILELEMENGEPL